MKDHEWHEQNPGVNPTEHLWNDLESRLHNLPSFPTLVPLNSLLLLLLVATATAKRMQVLAVAVVTRMQPRKDCILMPRVLEWDVPQVHSTCV